MSFDNNVIAYYGNASGCTRNRLAAIDFAFASQQAADKQLWSLSPQGPITADNANPPPIVWRYNLAIYPPGYNAAGWLGSRGY